VSATRGLFAAGLAVALAACGDGSGSGADPGEQTDAAAPQDDLGTGGGAPGGSIPDAAAPDATPPDAAAPEVCSAKFLYDPLASTQREPLPDDVWTVDDPSTPTGLRIDTTEAPWRARTPAALRFVFSDLDTLDGWGVSAGIVLRFDASLGEVPSGVATATEGPISLWALPEGGAAFRVPFEVQVLDDAQTLVLWPMTPLPAATRAGVVVTRALRTADGGCVSRPPALDAVLRGTTDAPRLQRLTPRHTDLLEAAGVSVDDAVVSLVFTTQSTTNVSVAVAEDIRNGAQAAADAAPAATCTPLADFVRCEGTLSLTNYRDADGRIDDAVSALRYDLPYTLLLPVERDAPAPLIVLGHGLGGDRSIGADVAQALSPEGFAVLAIDAVGHGDHPTRPAGDPNLAVLDFLGLDIGTQTVRGLRLRDNLRQSTYDKLQVLAVLKARPDVDGDGAIDLDVNRIAYWGVSLGGIMGSEPIALSGDFDAAVLTVAGARLMPIVTEADSFAGFKPIIGNLVGGVAELDRGLPVVQALVDGGDPVAYAPHVLRDRLPGAGERVPHLLQQMVIDDEIVSNGTNRSLARALGVPHVPPFFQEVGLIVEEESAPVEGNLEGGRTAGLFQFDRMRTTQNGRPVKASHNNALGLEGFGQVFRFLATWRDGGAPELLDPYTEFMTP